MNEGVDHCPLSYASIWYNLTGRNPILNTGERNISEAVHFKRNTSHMELRKINAL